MTMLGLVLQQWLWKVLRPCELELNDCITKLVDLSRDQHGSRFIQQKLDICDVQTKDTVFVELTKYALDIANDVFGNYVEIHVLRNPDQCLPLPLSLAAD